MKRIFTALICLGSLCSCVDYLDVVPDNIATLDIAFNNRSSAERYLTTCYSYVPLYGDQDWNPGLTAGNEIWYYSMDDNVYVQNLWAFGIANGLQNIVTPLNNYWDGEERGMPLFQAIRDCNIFIEYVSDRNRVAGLYETERRRWLAEAKVLKAFFHYYLFQLYGPIPIIDKSLPIDASVEEVRVSRNKVDDVVDYIVRTIDECYTDLPKVIQMEAVELGRLTQAAALAIKAKTLVLAASPLFNGNTDYANFLDHDHKPFISQEQSTEKWERAAEACRDAIRSAVDDGKHDLYDFSLDATYPMPDELLYGMNTRQAVTERFNKELIWSVGTQSTFDLQINVMPLITPGTNNINASNANSYCKANYAPTLAVAERFYSSNGVPIEEDKVWNDPANDYYNRRYQTQSTNGYSEYLFKQNYETAILHFNREPRFYGSLGFDGSTWYGNGWKNPDDVDTRNYVEAKKNQRAGQTKMGIYSITGYYAKKLIYYDNTYGSSVSVREVSFPDHPARRSLPALRRGDERSQHRQERPRRCIYLCGQGTRPLGAERGCGVVAELFHESFEALDFARDARDHPARTFHRTRIGRTALLRRETLENGRKRVQQTCERLVGGPGDRRRVLQCKEYFQPTVLSTGLSLADKRVRSGD